MSEALIYEFDGVTADQYHAVNAALGTDAATGEGDWPAGLRSHTGTMNAAGRFVLFEVWDSQESQAAFVAARLGPALGQVGVPEPTRMEWLTVLGSYTG